MKFKKRLLLLFYSGLFSVFFGSPAMEASEPPEVETAELKGMVARNFWDTVVLLDHGHPEAMWLVTIWLTLALHYEPHELEILQRILSSLRLALRPLFISYVRIGMDLYLASIDEENYGDFVPFLFDEVSTSAPMGFKPEDVTSTIKSLVEFTGMDKDVWLARCGTIDVMLQEYSLFTTADAKRRSFFPF
ncbi:MAG: hypothetical protein LBC25_01350 [Holosporales bacterium]|nr:hypothetical protein [Holosporales bacterium]